MATQGTISKKVTSFRFKPELMESLRKNAAKENRTLNNYVESVLLEHEFNSPNAETRAVMEEAERGEYAGIIDTDHFDDFWNSIIND